MDIGLSVRDLRAVVEVAEHGSFARAAEALWISRASMSEQIRGVERSLGVRLFDRTTRRVALTPAGKVFIDHAARLLTDLAGMREAVREAGERPHGTVRLGVPAGVVTQRIWHVLSAFRSAYPEIEIVFAETTIHDLILQVRKGELDLSVVAWPAGHGPTGVDTAELAASPTGVVLAPDHELAQHPELTSDELSDLPLVTFVEGFALRDIAADFCHRAGLSPDIALQSSVDETVSSLVRAKVGYTVITRDRAKQDGLVLVPTTPACLDRVLGLAWPAGGGPQASAARMLRRRIIDAYHIAP